MPFSANTRYLNTIPPDHAARHPGDRAPHSFTVQVAVPDIGDFNDVPIIEVFVKPGDVVNADDPLITLESDKASMDVPTPRTSALSRCASVEDKALPPSSSG